MKTEDKKKTAAWKKALIVIENIAVGSIRVSNIILTILLFLIIAAVIVILLVDRYATNSLYSSQIISFILGSGLQSPVFFLASWISRFSLASMFTFFVICAFLVFIKIILKKFIKKLKTTTFRIVIASIINLLTNIFLLVIALIVFINIIFVGYINNTFGTLFNESPEGYQYTEKVALIETQLNNQKTAATLALNKLVSDVNLGVIDLNKLDDEDYIHLGLEVCQLIDLKGGVSTPSEHYFRNRFSRAPETLDEMVKAILVEDNKYGWRLMSPYDSLFHMNGKDGEYNLKFISANGRFEAVYNRSGTLLVERNSPANMGTFNYASPTTDKGKHLVYDILPYFRWTNTPLGPPVNDDILEKARDKYDHNPDAKIRYETYKNLFDKKKEEP